MPEPLAVRRRPIDKSSPHVLTPTPVEKTPGARTLVMAAIGKSLPVTIDELPIPDEYVGDVDRILRVRRVRSKAERSDVERDFKLQIHFGGQHVLCRKTRHGQQILAVGHPGDGSISTWLESTESDGPFTVLMPSPWQQTLDHFADA